KGKIGFFKTSSHEIIEIEKCLIADERINEKLKRIAFPPAANDVEVRVDGLRTFAQVNDPQNENMVKLVLDFADPKPEEKIVDLYCGAGNFTFPLAQSGASVTGIEKNGAELEEARKRGEKGNIRWIQQTAFSALVGLKGDGVTCDTLVADPPRRGLAEAVEGVIALKPKKIVYVSCNPATFARDAGHLAKAGYVLEKCQPLDMFPHTSHVEIVSLFKWFG
ncbi:MAG: methyltransferase domain-containing protein, partial [Deltaproteobacteria bacterium]|nr:methyltransferase domain-containing protein [Deltaproteobacteria bacterium]